MKTLQLTLVALGLLLASTASRADTPPDYYPKTFTIIGVLNGIEARSQTMTIDDRGHRYDVTIKVHTQTSQFSSLSNLRPGMTVGASMTVGQNSRITEIWVLPKGYRPTAPPLPR